MSVTKKHISYCTIRPSSTYTMKKTLNELYKCNIWYGYNVIDISKDQIRVRQWKVKSLDTWRFRFSLKYI